MKISRKPASAFLFLIAIAVSGCSSSVLEENKGNDQPGISPGQGVTVATCRGIDTSTETLAVQQFRELIACLNGNGSIDAYQRLVERMSDRQLSPFVDLLNKHLLTNARRFKDLRESFEHLDQNGILDVMLDRSADLLGEDGLALSFIKLARPAVLQADGKVDPLILQSLKVLAAELKSGKGVRSNLEKGLAALVRVTELDAWKQLAAGLQIPISAPRPVLEILAKNLFKYAQAKAKEPKPYLRVPMWGLVDGSLFELTDHYTSGGQKDLYVRPRRMSDKKWKRTATRAASVARQRIDSLDATLQYLLVEHHLDILPQLSEAFYTLDRPIACFGDSKTIPNGTMYVIDQIAGFSFERAAYSTARDLAILTKVGADACDFPASVDAQLDAIFKLVADDDHLHGETLARLMKSLQAADARPIHSQSVSDIGLVTPANERYQRLVVDLLSDAKGEPNFLTAVVPALSEVAQPFRGVLPNVLYLSYGLEPGSKEREVLVSVVSALMEPREGIRVRDMIARSVGKTKASESIYDVLMQGFLRLDSDVFAETFAKAASVFSKDKAFASVLAKSARDAFLVNNAQPATDIFIEVLEHADQHADLIQALFEVAEFAEFPRAIELTARMSRDGSLKDFIRGTFSLFDGRLKRVAGGPVLAKKIPVVGSIPDYRNLSRKVGEQPIRSRLASHGSSYWPKSSKGISACQALNPSVGFLDYSHADWSSELKELAACINADGEMDALEDFVALATDERRPVRSGQSLAEFITRLTSQFKERLTANEKKALLRVLGNQIDDGSKRKRLYGTFDALPYFLRTKWCGESDGKCARSQELTFVEALADLGQSIRDHGVDLNPLTALSARVVGKPYFLEAIDATVDSWIDARDGGIAVSSAEKPSFDPALVSEIERQIVEAKKGWLGKDPLPWTGVAAMPHEVAEVVTNYWSQVVSDRPVTRYRSKAEFFERVMPMVDSLADPQFGLLEQAATFFYLMDRNPYDAAWWNEWFHRLSSNRTAILYYYPGTYPGKDKPSVRVVNQIDVLELVVIDGDFSLKEIGQSTFGVGKYALGLIEDIIIEEDENFAIRNLAQLARAGDNIPGWLAQLKRELGIFWSYITNENAKCRGAVVDIVDFKCSDLFVDELKRRLFNLRQILPLLEQLTKQQEYVSAPNGGVVLRNDVGFLRDVFYAVLMATPKNNQYTYRREVNTLNFIVNLVKSGTLRNIGTSMWSVDSTGKPRATDLKPVISTLIKVLVFKEKGEYKLNSNTMQVLQALLKKDGCWENDPNCASRPLEKRYPFLSKVLSSAFSWGDSDRRFAKATAYELVEVLDKADRVSAKKGEFFAIRLSQALRPWLGEQNGINFLSRHWAEAEDLLMNRRVGALLARVQKHRHYSQVLELLSDITVEAGENGAAIAEKTKSVVLTLDADPKKRASRFVNVLSEMSEDKEMGRIQRDAIEPLIRSTVDWLLEEPVIGSKLQTHLSQRLMAEDIQALLNYAAKNKDSLVAACHGLGSRDVTRRMQRFIDDLAAALQNSNFRR